MPCWPKKEKKAPTEKEGTPNTPGTPQIPVIFINETNTKRLSTPRGSLLKSLIKSHSFETKEIFVLQDIFSHLTVNELLRIRTVSKIWNSAACYVLRRKIEGAVILQRGLSYYSHVMGRSLEIPVGRLFLKVDTMEDPAALQFFEVVGPSILQLVLNLEGSGFASFLSQTKYLKNLEQLSLNLFQEEQDYEGDAQQYRKRKATSIKIFIEDYDNPKKYGSQPTLEHLESFVLSCEPEWKSNEALLLEKLLEMSPNLKNLNLGKWPFLLKPDTFKRCEFQSLKFLSLKLLDDEACMILSKKKLPCLKTFECELSNDVSREAFHGLLESMSSSVEYIEITNQYDYELDFKLPTLMKELNTIRLPTWAGGINLDSILVNAPKLEKLQLSHVDPTLIVAKDYERKAPNMKYLAVNFGSGSHPMKKIFKVLKGFVAAFPNLKVFMMKKVSDKVLEIICEGWPHLEALRITTSFALTDSGISGLPDSTLQRIAKSEHRLTCGCCVPFPVVDGKVQADKDRIAPCITALKELKDLRIESEMGTHWTLTNLSLHFGIGELTKLNYLKLTSNELGPHWCLKYIADSFNHLQHLTLMDRAISHDRYDEQELSYLLRKLPKLTLTFAEAGEY